MQRRVTDLEKRIEVADIKEKSALASLDKITKDLDKLKHERDTFENMVHFLNKFIVPASILLLKKEHKSICSYFSNKIDGGIV